MKIRAGFVSNSSSTSFLIISKRDLNKADFLELMGVERGSPVSELFEGFYKEVLSCISGEVDFKTADKTLKPALWFGPDAGLSDRMLEKLNDARKRGLKAYYGRLSSDGGPIQSFFCTDEFEVENEKIYFNGLDNAW